VEFIEAPSFTQLHPDYLDDEGFRQLQLYLASNPEAERLSPEQEDSESFAGWIREGARASAVA
jgi:hypothetical protein